MDRNALVEAMIQQQLVARGVRDSAVLDAVRAVPRERFLPGGDPAAAYADHALQIGAGQTISQPYVVARMTELLDVEKEMRVLEVGTGSGYQAAVLAQLGAHVYSIERHAELAERARNILEKVGAAKRVTIDVRDGTLGWPDHAPYDRIIVTAGAPDVPVALVEQLADGGRMVIPIGQRKEQTMTVVVRVGENVKRYADFPCRFVPLVGEQGWPES